MKQTSNELLRAVRFALYAGSSAVVGLTAATPVFAQDAADQGSEKLETIVVTGSRIRRVDLETANPVVTIDRAAIEKTGKLTVGDLVQELPSISGAATNPQVNNGGGSGASTVSMRGLGSQRTLILINGHRVVQNPPTVGQDINQIPANLVERIEILKDGASAVYGSDAIGGVVNFILRTDYEGAEITADYGISDRDDGERQGFSATFGTTSDRGSVIGGINYNKYDGVAAAARDFAKDALYLSGGYVSAGGSSRNPGGRIYVPKNIAVGLNPALSACGADSSGNVSLNLKEGNGQAGTDYRCYSGARDSFNYQPFNLVLTPQERTNIFALGKYRLTDSVEAYLNVYHSKTTSNFQIAPLPFDARGDGVKISKDSYYNPFGVDFGSETGPDGKTITYQQFLTRFVGNGNRVGHFTTSSDQGIFGLKGNIGDSSWQWDASYNYGHYSQLKHSFGYINLVGLKQAVGPSFEDENGNIVCGSPGNVIAGCTPLNIFNIFDPQSVATLDSLKSNPFSNSLYIMRQGELNFNGDLFELPAGTVGLAVGVAHRKEYQNFQTDYTTIVKTDAGTCDVAQEACTSPTVGDFTVKEAYAEMLIPVLKDVFLARALNITIGSRYSDYSSVGNTTNSKLSVEWRPIDDLLLRGTVSEVFRAPTISDLYAGRTGSAPQFADPCIGLNNANHPNGCENVPTNGTFQGTGLSQTTGVLIGAVPAGISLKPEEGKSFDYGIVYDPHWLEGFSVNVDYWRIYLNDTITTILANTVANVCFNNDASPFCNYITRFPDGQVNFILEPTVNLGRLDTKGVDVGFKYRLPETSIGNFGVSLDATYVARYDNDPAPGTPGDVTAHVAGHYNNQYGNYARWRALAGVNWNLGAFDASWRIRYVGGVSVGSEDPAQGISADGCYQQPICTQFGLPNVENPVRLHFGAQVYNNVQFGYNIEPINTRIDVGIDNVFDKQPPIMYQNNVLNANTDVSTYDTLGRFYWARVGVKF